MERILTTIQLGFAICLLAFSIGSGARCIITGADTFYTVCFAAMTVTSWHLMVIPAWREYKQTRSDKEGGQR